MLASLIKALFAPKPWAGLCELLGVTERTAKHRIFRTRDFSADEVADLLRSEHGFDVLCAIMADAPRPPRWWRACAPLMTAHEARKLQHEARRRLRRAVEDAWNEDAGIEGDLDRAESALAHFREDAGRGVAVAARPPHGLGGGAVAGTARPRR